MGHDGMLPRIFGSIHRIRQAPHVAELVTGLVLLVVAISFPIETVGSGASLMFLLSFALTNLAALLIRIREPELKRRFVAPFFPIPQILGVVTCIILALSRFWLQPVAWAIAGFWVLLDLARPNLVPTRLDNLTENLIWAADGSEIDTVVARGRVLKQGGLVQPFADGTTPQQVMEAVQRLSERFAAHLETAPELSGTGAHQ